MTIAAKKEDLGMKTGDLVVDDKGRVGMIIKLGSTPVFPGGMPLFHFVKFSPNGPFEEVEASTLRRATRQEELQFSKMKP